jgi:hypothetical protein
MSSRFVSAGKFGSSGEISKDASGAESTPQQPLHSSAKSKEWEAVEQQLEAERKKREEQRIKAATGEGEKSLYDVLQANKGEEGPFQGHFTSSLTEHHSGKTGRI